MQFFRSFSIPLLKVFSLEYYARKLECEARATQSFQVQHDPLPSNEIWERAQRFLSFDGP
jgi:hypothetical protein